MAYPKPVRFIAALLLPAATLLPAAVIAEQGPAPLATMPAAPPPIGLPQLQSQLSCPALQQRLLATVGGQASLWSITIADSQGRLLADLNGSRPRIPASNQKLVSTAYALDRLGTDYRLSTQLWRLSDGSFRLTGEGDPRPSPAPVAALRQAGAGLRWWQRPAAIAAETADRRGTAPGLVAPGLASR